MESAEEGISLGIDDYIAKPAAANLLVALLADTCWPHAREPPKQHVRSFKIKTPTRICLMGIFGGFGLRVCV